MSMRLRFTDASIAKQLLDGLQAHELDLDPMVRYALCRKGGKAPAGQPGWRQRGRNSVRRRHS